jgi:hypothetical protein
VPGAATARYADRFSQVVAAVDERAANITIM